MIERARLGPDDVLFDLGCGDGRIVIEAARRHGCRGVGIELDPALVEQSRQNARAAGVDRLVEFRVQDATKADFTTATVVMLYLLPESNALLRPVLERQLRPGARVLSHNYAIPGWDEKLVEDASLSEGGEMHYVYVYRR
ncbi:MAG: class I SAM-dependent methyltransferase [Deltaproteobacteria bacterium]|nr:class I SAM-dependent methyltransferase [Deltaproteobacteria bacterium]